MSQTPSVQVETLEPSLAGLEIFDFGEGNGPAIAITAGIHGNEQTAIHAARLIMAALSELTVTGRVRVIPVANPLAYRARSRVSPIDGLDLNRLFNQKVKEASTSHHLASKLWGLTRDVDYLLDLHCCSVYGSTYVCSLHDLYEHQYELSRALGVKVAVHSSGTAGQLVVEANRTGQKGILIELPGGQPDGLIDGEAAEACCQSALNYLRYLQIIDGEHEQYPVDFYGKIDTIAAPADGLFVPGIRPGEMVKKGQLVGTFDGEPVSAILTGAILAVQPMRYAFAGERLVKLAAPQGAGNVAG